jgi:hypothetical protein
MSLMANEVIQRSEVRRHEQAQPFHINFKPMYSLERIRRRALCEALCEGIPDADLLAMQPEFQKLAKALKRSAAPVEDMV